MKHKEFLLSEFWVLSWGASVQRAGLYKSGSDPIKRANFRTDVIGYVTDRLMPLYKRPVTERKHLTSIEELSRHGSRLGRSILSKDGYRIGVAQKLLNLQLKYLWCTDLVAEPPHCPVDRVIINKTRLRNQVSWTQMNSIDEYAEVISAIREKSDASGCSLAQWELAVFDRSDA